MQDLYIFRQLRGQRGSYDHRIKILSVPTAWEHNLGPKSTRTLESWESIMPGGLNQRVETKESFVRGEARFVLGAGIWAAGKHFKVVREWGSFAGVEQVFDRDRSVDACEAPVSPLEVKGRRPIIRFILHDRPGSAFAGAKILRGGMGTKVAATDNCVNVGSDSTR